MRFITTVFFVFSTFFCATFAQAELEIVHKFDASTPPGNIAVGPDGRIFMSLHAFYGPDRKVVEVKKDGSTVAYPPNGWGLAASPETGRGLHDVLGVRADANGVLWMLDSAGKDHAGRLVGWDTKAEKLHKIIYLSRPNIGDDVFLNDIAVDLKNNAIYVSDTASATTSAILVVSLETGQVRRVLHGHVSTIAEDIDMVIDERTINLGGSPARIGINPITLDTNNEWFYYGPMSGTSLYRVKTEDLNDASLSASDLASRVERFGDRPISDGASIDGAGNIYITDITNDAIGVVKPDGSYEVLHQRDDISWPDGYAYGPDDKMYVVINELHRSPVLNGGENGSKGEFAIMRFDPVAKGKIGR